MFLSSIRNCHIRLFKKKIWLSFAILSILFHVGLIFVGLVPSLVSRPMHLVFLLPWVFIYERQSRIRFFSGLLFTIGGISVSIWIAVNHVSLGDQYGFLESNVQIFFSILIIICIIEAARRVVGWPLPVMAISALFYGLFGSLIPGEFGHTGMPIESFLGTMIITEGGIWGSLTGISVGIVSIFVIFGAFLNAGEAGQGFMNIAKAIAGRLKGGAAKVAVVSSALFGSISGSASANVASTGAITLPAMTRLGYPRPLAGAVEAVASSGGQIMPPLMGAGAFVMVELTGTPYKSLMGSALLPAILYFFAVWVGINAYATIFQLRKLDADGQPNFYEIFVTSLFFLIPFCTLLSGIFLFGLTAQYSACQAILVAASLLLVNRNWKMDITAISGRFAIAFISSAKQIAMIGSIIFCASLIIGVLSLTGLGVKLTSLIMSASGDLIWPSLLLTAFACLLLGMEVPTTAAYVICVSVAGPALIELGLRPLMAHLFVFWYALLSTITPPVCGAVFIASGMIKENWLQVSGKAMKLGLGLYIIPMGMIANPSLINLMETPFLAINAFLKVALGLYLLSTSLISKSALFVRLVLFTLGLIVIFFDHLAIF